MKYGMTAAILAICALMQATGAEEETKPRNWHVSGNVVYSSRSLDGTIANQSAIAGGVFGDLVATGESMDVGTSDGAMLALAVQYKKVGLGINYMPTSFEGQGTALVALSGSTAGAYTLTDLDTNIDVTMLLANLYYNFIQTPDTVFGLGVGFGQTSIVLSIVPTIGSPLAYEGDQPFGFLNMHFSSNYKRFLYGFALNGISGNFQGVEVVYSDYKVDLGYRVIDKKMKLDIMGGYRLVNFAVDLEGNGNKTAADVSLEGPFLGITATY